MNILLLSVMMILNMNYYTTTAEFQLKHKEITYNNPPTREDVYDELLKQDVLFPDIALRQAITETNCGKTGI